tara:strand:+ start:5328 stop:5597 length:270 start_codon:yes stop_codon:yes gene_type:complete
MMDYTVTYYKSDGWNTIEDHKKAKDKEQAEDIFEGYLKKELENEIAEGYISDQEFTNIVCNGIYTYSDDDIEVTISIELTEDIFGYINE